MSIEGLANKINQYIQSIKSIEILFSYLFLVGNKACQFGSEPQANIMTLDLTQSAKKRARRVVCNLI
ncbi:hypothetical protein BGP78_20780 [Pseudoalteromonas sp. MSK9-3]|nr:hypothetical protein BGP78_20780 [Pseudoalteromonas sp. MSK9-3]